jgi:hypothetical protein
MATLHRLVLPTLAALALAPLPAAVMAAAEGGDGGAQAAPAHTFLVNGHVSAAAVALNQPVLVDFTTPRQRTDIDISGTVANSIALTAAANWRLLGKPAVEFNGKGHTETVTVTINLMARTSGDLALPQIPVTWMQGDVTTQFGHVKVADTVLIGGESRDLPKVVTGVGGFAWGSSQTDLHANIPDSLWETKGDRVLAHPRKGLDLVFRGGQLAAAEVNAPGLTLDQARASFLDRWGLPQQEDAASLTWVLGWTCITATATDQGVHLLFEREDIQARLDRGQVKERVFNLIEGAEPDAPAQPADASGAIGATGAAPR